MENIILILILISCISSTDKSSSSTSSEMIKKFHTNEEEEQVGKKELEIGKELYELLDTIDLEKEKIYKIFKENQKDIDRIIYHYIEEFINDIKSKLEKDEEKIQNFCKNLHKEGIYTTLTSRGIYTTLTNTNSIKEQKHISIYVNYFIKDIYRAMYSSIKEELIQDEVNKEEMRKKIKEKLIPLPLHFQAPLEVEIKDLMREFKDPLEIYESIEKFSLPFSMKNIEKVEVLFLILMKKYDKLFDLLLEYKNFYKK